MSADPKLFSAKQTKWQRVRRAKLARFAQMRPLIMDEDRKKVIRRITRLRIKLRHQVDGPHGRGGAKM